MTGTISTGIPASTQSIRFWQLSSLYRKLPVAVIVKIDIGRARRSSAPSRKSAIISAIRGTPCSVKAPDTTGFVEFVEAEVEAPGVGDLRLDVARRERRREVRDVREAVAEPDVLGEVLAHRQPRLARPVVEHLQPGRAGDEVDPILAEVRPRLAAAVVQGEAARRDADGLLDHVAREEDPPVGALRQPGVDQPLAQPGPADLHPVRGQDALRLVDDALDQLRLEDAQARVASPR